MAIQVQQSLQAIYMYCLQELLARQIWSYLELLGVGQNCLVAFVALGYLWSKNVLWKIQFFQNNLEHRKHYFSATFIGHLLYKLDVVQDRFRYKFIIHVRTAVL